ncbi:MAG: rRNA maturation RNase YbeY [Verrucomicrobia bacterium]|nr:rRNA maturation RNase YbeY [Verrucomicrobiota bacterium]
MNRLIVCRNRQRVCGVNLSLLRVIVRALLSELIQVRQYELCVHLVDASTMARLNESYLGHSGSTDVITFDNTDALRPGGPACLRGEIFLSVDDAWKQAGQFRASWQSEIVRYVIHGILHLQGFDDLTPARRRIMKRAENSLLKQISRRFDLRKLNRRSADACAPSAPRRKQPRPKSEIRNKCKIQTFVRPQSCRA